MLIHFQIRGARGWEAIGSGVCEDEDPQPGAIEGLRSPHGGRLPAGRYRYFEASGSEPGLGNFDLGCDGETIDD